MSKKELGPQSTWKEMTMAGNIYHKDTIEFSTADWRTETPKWIEEKCKQCLLCNTVCPDSAIIIKDGKMAGMNYQHCKGCGLCKVECPFNAIEMVLGRGIE